VPAAERPGREARPDGQVDLIKQHIVLTGDIDEAQREQLHTIAGRCPVHKTLTMAHPTIIEELEVRPAG
jgi:uncharacterized OsmC-like protein